MISTKSSTFIKAEPTLRKQVLKLSKIQKPIAKKVVKQSNTKELFKLEQIDLILKQSIAKKPIINKPIINKPIGKKPIAQKKVIAKTVAPKRLILTFQGKYINTFNLD
ncbi:uncharacterized protein ASCRUDRAFT_70583 [Ascoidea rubescens DSM 1968]|uniref:Uncharacterized protein n=1 Tax=Ascoidea rubescens DSM 1968 TaxID=1344418 RepID=A0A1D2VGJ1_9ASCO|nr:hypothetical protein ASCRUDRAFT_70583 [Ascoidea rubescens DSM 1968]ODV60702.1 hypothetical protein ASCRUDRAFT_70583 [Ascoidea rubescens DSM 1968]